MLIGTLGGSLLGSIRVGDEVIQADKRTIGLGQYF